MGIWREHGGGGRGGRRPSVNIIPTSSGSPVDESKFCPRCGVQLSYLKEEDIWACVKCAWNLPRHLLKEEPSPSLSPSLSSSPNQNKVVTVDMAEAESASLRPPSPPPSSLSSHNLQLYNEVMQKIEDEKKEKQKEEEEE